MALQLTIAPDNLARRGILSFDMRGDGNHLEVHVFTASEWTGDITESDEMEPRWWKVDEIPYDKMWIDDKVGRPCCPRNQPAVLPGSGAGRAPCFCPGCAAATAHNYRRLT